MNYSEALAWLFSTQRTGIKLGLENTRRLLAALDQQAEERGQPQLIRDLRCVHVAGTNGKGSVCALLEAICRAEGYRTGLYISPHLVTFRERMRLAGDLIPEPEAAAGLTRLRALTADWTHLPTFFELTTVLALDWFARAGAEVVVLETGLGGRLDSTNAITPRVGVVTAIDFDHVAVLGDTLDAIAFEKAGIFKPGVPAVSVPQLPEVSETLTRVAEKVGAPLRFVTEPIPTHYRVNLVGSHQRLHAALARTALEAAGVAVTDGAVTRGLAGVEWPGRFQRLEDGRIILDGAHNPAAARRLVTTWREEFGEEAPRPTIIIGLLRDKDRPAVCRELAALAARFLVVPVRSPRSSTVDHVLSALSRGAPDVPCEPLATLAEALARARTYPETILVSGSLFLVGEALTLLLPELYPAMETSAQ